jgi:hypothetical protein
VLVSDRIKSWLLEPSDPSVRYRTYVELLATPADEPEAAEAFMAIPASVSVRQILERMHPDGFWLQQKPRTLGSVGDGVEYGSFATTHFCLSYLAHLGMNLRNKQVALAANRYLDLLLPEGDWTPAQSPWKVGKRGQPNRWMTLYALLALKAAGKIVNSEFHTLIKT